MGGGRGLSGSAGQRGGHRAVVLFASLPSCPAISTTPHTQYVDYGFTSGLEEQLDAVSGAKVGWGDWGAGFVGLRRNPAVPGRMVWQSPPHTLSSNIRLASPAPPCSRAGGGAAWKAVLGGFWGPFNSQLGDVSSVPVTQVIDRLNEMVGDQLIGKVRRRLLRLFLRLPTRAGQAGQAVSADAGQTCPPRQLPPRRSVRAPRATRRCRSNFPASSVAPPLWAAPPTQTATTPAPSQPPGLPRSLVATETPRPPPPAAAPAAAWPTARGARRPLRRHTISRVRLVTVGAVRRWE